MSFLRSAALAFSMFSRIPMPKVAWSEENMRFLLAAFPLVGAAIAVCLRTWLWVCDLLGFGEILFAAGATLLPILISGGVHMDGYCDTVDARKSCQPPEKKREILKDPHAGAFSVIYLGIYLLLYFALATELPRTPRAVWCLGCAPVVSRSVSALVSLSSEIPGEKGLLRAFRDGASRRPALLLACVWLFLGAAGMALCHPAALIMPLAAVATGWGVKRMARREFGGMRGDLAGYLLQVAEILMLATLILTQKVVLKWF